MPVPRLRLISATPRRRVIPRIACRHAGDVAPSATVKRGCERCTVAWRSSGKEGEIPQRITKLRFPDGDAEYRTTQVDLKVGTIIRSRGQDWVIASVTDGLAMLEWPEVVGDGASADGEGQAPVQLPAAPSTKRSIVGDDPIVLEALEEM
jgi:hypothetical protein